MAENPGDSDVPAADNGAASVPHEPQSAGMGAYRPPRDLTLLLPNKSKKKYVPNFNVKRTKISGPKPDAPAAQPERVEPKTVKKDSRKRNKAKVITTHGIFSEGLGEKEKKSTSRRSSTHGNIAPGPAPMKERPPVDVKDAKIDKESVEKTMKSLFSDEGRAQWPNEDFHAALELDDPVQLPLGGKTYGVEHKLPKTESSIGEKLKEIMSKKDGTMILFQLPDSLPFQRRDANDPEQPSGSAGDTKPENFQCSLSQVAEGYFGTMQVHKSGKVTFKSGDTQFEVCSGTSPAFHQEVVSLIVNEETKSADIVPLGDLKDKLIITPDWESLFSRMNEGAEDRYEINPQTTEHQGKEIN